MAIDFPNSPSEGQSFSVGDRTWVWSSLGGGFWRATSTTIGYVGSAGYLGSFGYTGSQGVIGPVGYVGSQGIQGIQGDQGIRGYTGSAGVGGGGGGGASVTVSDTTPGAAAQGYLWFNSNTATLKIYYNDSSSEQWVDIASQPGPRGYTGSKGDPTGYTGSQGPANGYTGSVGFTGSVGGINTNKSIAMSIIFGG